MKYYKTICLIIIIVLLLVSCKTEVVSQQIINENNIMDESIMEGETEWPFYFDCLDDKNAMLSFISELVNDKEFVSLICVLIDDSSMIDSDYVSYAVDYQATKNGLSVYRISDGRDVSQTTEIMQEICDKHGFFPLRDITVQKTKDSDGIIYSYGVLFKSIYHNESTDKWKYIGLEYRTNYIKGVKPKLNLVRDIISSEEFIEYDNGFCALFINY